jgi:hypothetical protein
MQILVSSRCTIRSGRAAPAARHLSAHLAKPQRLAASRFPLLARSWGMLNRPQKITLAEMRASGVHGLACRRKQKAPSMAWGLGSDDGRGSVSYFTDVRFSSFNGSRTSQCNDGLFVLNSGILRMGQGPRSTGKKIALHL